MKYNYFLLFTFLFLTGDPAGQSDSSLTRLSSCLEEKSHENDINSIIVKVTIQLLIYNYETLFHTSFNHRRNCTEKPIHKVPFYLKGIYLINKKIIWSLIRAFHSIIWIL